MSKKKRCKYCGRVDYMHKWKGFKACGECVKKWDSEWKEGRTPAMVFLGRGRSQNKVVK